MSEDGAMLEHLAGTCVQKIRELEAELAESDAALLEWHQVTGFAEPQEATARAEKAETERDALEASAVSATDAALAATMLAKRFEARAEKTESLVADAKKVLANLRSQVLVLMSEKRRAEVRIAELDGQLGSLMDYIVSNGLRLPNWTKPILEAREREADG